MKTKLELKLAKRLYSIRGRCGRAKYYKNIKCYLNIENLLFLWNRDNAEQMKSPSIDRIDSRGDYEINNCRFLELTENIRRASIRKFTRVCQCPQCGKIFSALKNTAYCSPECWAEYRKVSSLYRVDLYSTLSIVPCAYCKKLFSQKLGWSVTCSMVCRGKNYSKNYHQNKFINNP